MNSFDWQWWQYFISIVEHGSMNKAALSLGVSPPTLSRQLLAMENQPGQSLFDRSTQGLTLTIFGKAYWKKASACNLPLSVYKDLDKAILKPLQVGFVYRLMN